MVTIISGGSGNTAIVNALLDHNIDFRILVNAYDNGKSTGVCREVANVLGPSDIRKNHFKIWKHLNKDNLDSKYCKAIIDLFETRIDVDINDLSGVQKLFDDADISKLMPYVERFLNKPYISNFNFNNFSISNILYAQLYSELGYEAANHLITHDILRIDDYVILNSFDNVKLLAKTESGNVILDEGDLVEWCNAEDPIVDNLYVGTKFELNAKAIDLIDNSDTIIISTGTFWSSIYPTLQYLDFYEHINNSRAKKIWIMNSAEDKDAYGVSSNDFIHIVKNLGLDLSDFTIIENLDAVDKLKMLSKENIKYASLKNINGKNDSEAVWDSLKEYICQ